MKFIKVFIALVFLGSFLFFETSKAWALNPYRSLCVGIQGRFNANSTWKGGNIQIGCAGDDGGAVPASRRQSEACLGEVQTVRPGELFRLTKCSCFGSDKGCMKIGKELKLEPLVDGKRRITVVRRIDEMPTFINNDCRINKSGDICGSNGQQISGNVKITCAVPHTSTPTRNPSNTPTPMTPLPSGVTPTSCPTPGKVTNVRITCPNCSGEVTPTPTSEPSN